MRGFVIALVMLASTVVRADGGPPPPLASPPPGPRVTTVMHNGSLMHAIANGPYLEIRYFTPRPGLWEAGVRPGTLLLAGQWSGTLLSGIAYVFAEGCPPFSYLVSGSVDPETLILTMQGAAPITIGCHIVGWAWTPNSVLVFIPGGF